MTEHKTDLYNVKSRVLYASKLFRPSTGICVDIYREMLADITNARQIVRIIDEGDVVAMGGTFTDASVDVNPRLPPTSQGTATPVTLYRNMLPPTLCLNNNR